jgi:hypothetical protein
MKLIYSDPALCCDSCGAIRRDPVESDAEAAGWLVVKSSDPHAHLCPKCAHAPTAPLEQAA